MIVERNIFYLKFGKAREAQQAMKDMMAGMDTQGKTRMLTDLTGDSYRLILEHTADSLTEFEARYKEMDMKGWREKYEKFIPLCERAHREFLTVVS